MQLKIRGEAWLGLSDDVRGSIEAFAADLLRFNRAQNLVSRQDPKTEVARLVEECVRAGEPLSLGGGSWVDVGSGAGFPGLVLAALHPSTHFVLVERRDGRCDFLERSVARMGLENVVVTRGEVERLGGRAFDWMSGKAVVSPARMAQWAEGLLRPAGRLLVFRRAGWDAQEFGPGWAEESGWCVLEDARQGDRWAYVLRRTR